MPRCAVARRDDSERRADRRADCRTDPAASRRACVALLALLPLPALPRTGAAMSAAPIDLATDGARWQVVNDGVMGGVSTSQIMSDANGVHFSGEVRTEFNGGFASARRAVDAASLPAAAVTFMLSAAGDGHRYRLVVYCRDGAGRALPFSYFAEFATDGGGVTHHALPLATFRASFRGRAVSDAPPLRSADVIGVGLMLTKDGHAAGRGAFSLRLLSLQAA